MYDEMLHNQGSIEKFLSQDLHSGADYFSLTQNYFQIPKQAVRDKANFVELFTLDGKNMISIHDAIVGGDMPFDESRDFCYAC